MRYFLALILILSSFMAQALPEIVNLQEEFKKVNWSEATSYSVKINAPLERVWKYASDSTKANAWSVFFDHISPLPGIKDGEIGSLRRCYRNANEKGEMWDEVTIYLEPLKMRAIVTYNLQGFTLNFLAKKNYVFVRQLYTKISETESELTFETYYSPEASIMTKLLFKISQRDTLRIFQENLINIKSAIEGSPRVYKWY